MWYVLMHLQVRGASCPYAYAYGMDPDTVLMHLQVRGASCLLRDAYESTAES